MTQVTQAGAPAAPAPLFSAGYRWLVLSLLLAAYTFNFIDRTIISTIGQAIKIDLKLTDTQLGLLGGLSFAILYTLLGVPIARLAERYSRVWIITVSLIVWSGFTAACGVAGSFMQLLWLRVGVGIGEAGCSPPAHSLISDYFEPKRRATALSIYAFGIPLGTMIGAALGGWVAKEYGWRIAFMAVGAPGVILALLFALLVKEPPRGHSDPPERVPVGPAAVAHAVAEGGHWLWSELKALGQVSAILFGKWPIMNIILGLTVTSFAGYGGGAFAGPYFIRTFGLDYATVGLVLGLIGGLSGGLGTLAGGFISDRASKFGAKWYALTPAIGIAIAAPIYIIAYRQPDWHIAAAILLVPGIFAYTYLGPSFGVVQNVVETRQRATAASMLLLFVNIIALGGGPLFTGWIIDAFAQFNFNHPGSGHIMQGLAGIFGGQQSAGPVTLHFATACPGGVAPHGSSPALASQCKGALVAATREGMIVTMLFLFWGATHYALAAIGLAKQLGDAADARKAREA
jgi:MFS family permease